jgi:SlyX protein
MPDDNRLTELEIALAHQERLAEELSEIVRGQADRLDRLERTLALLARRIEEADGRPDAPAAHAPPPHW